MADLVEVVWSGPFEAHDVNGRLVPHGAPIQVTARQAKENPGWYKPVPVVVPEVKPTKPVKEEPVVV